MIDAQTIPDISVGITDATQVPITLSAITDTGTTQLASGLPYAGFETDDCGTFTVTQQTL